MNNYQDSEKLAEKSAEPDNAAAEREAKEAKKMKIRKVLYPIAIIAIILLWASSLLGGK